MNTAIALLTLLQTGSPDLCADVYLDATGTPVTDADGTTLARYCAWTGPAAPVWQADVCCTIDQDGAHCSTPDPNGRCALGYKMFCEYGEQLGEGVTCYQPFPSVCDQGLCTEGVQAPGSSTPDLLCCNGTICHEWEIDELESCEGNLWWCSAGYLKEDGTVECYDD